ncbi:peptidase inhibitor family I36 protein [Streptomyces coeruleorubidus]|uniref:peptidase inhibitor family I36 protein n=1 Tax=Streptomyces coeruleorubidus TaxID=116188 RepID=UPI00237F7F67|nr:peptidase inhibitor family I36 protein [Streptomyces coeruleorubidus]WDV53622.1 peptidase inhibitor family I36 protein [Streptomyces coeruleorubidus]
MRMTRKLAVMTGGLALTGGLLAGGAGTAGAAEVGPQAASDCPSGWFCVWAGQNYTGRMQKVAGTNKDLTKFAVFQNFRSWYNHGASCDFQWFSEKNHRGSDGIIPRGNKATDSKGHYIKSNKWVNCK